LTNQTPLKEVLCEDTYTPVLNLMGIPSLDTYGYQSEDESRPWVKRWILDAFKALRTEGLGHSRKRGYWGLTEEGVQKLVTSPSQPEEGEDGGTYTEVDPYILGLMVQAVVGGCFGYFSQNSTTCSGCAVRHLCKEQKPTILSSLAAQMEVAIVKLTKAPSTSKDSGKGVLDQLTQRILADGYSVQRADAGTFCCICTDDIPQGEMVVWEPRDGIAHVRCFAEEKEYE
jgi:hypothetical protein